MSMNSFDKVIGYKSVKEELQQLVDMYANREYYVNMGAKFPRGVVLYGEPGMGKTLLATALLKECSKNGVKTFIIRKKKAFKETLDEIEDVFNAAVDGEPSMILIDDIDKFSDENGLSIDDETFVAIQANIDNVKDKDVLVVATANNIRKLPDSLLRSGRLDRKIRLCTPSAKDAREIIEYYMKSKNVDKNINYDDVANMISYSSCADLEAMLNESAIYAARERKSCIDINDIIKAYIRGWIAAPDDDSKCDNEEIRKTAIHEAGHAAIAEILKEGSVGCVYIKESGIANFDGATHLCKEHTRRPECVLVGLGGKAAVELFCEGRCASGCHSDIGRVMSLLNGGITGSGTCGIGMIGDGSTISDSLRSRVEAATQGEFERYMFIARDILIKNRDFIMKLADRLYEKHILLSSDIKEIRNSVTITGVTLP